MNKIAIIITMYNQVEYTKCCVESIKTTYPFELILVDDFSLDGTKEWMASLPNDVMGAQGLTKIIDEDTDSLGAKWNLGMQKAKELGCFAGLVCNNDILFNSKTIDNVTSRLIKAKEEGENIGLVSAHNRRGDTGPEAIFTLQIPENPSESDGPDFSCFLFSIDAWEKIGRFSEEFKPCYFEDNWTHTMLKIHDLRAISTTAAPYFHYGSITQNSVPNGLCSSPQFEKNRAKFVEIFGALPEAVDIERLRERFLNR